MNSHPYQSTFATWRSILYLVLALTLLGVHAVASAAPSPPQTVAASSRSGYAYISWSAVAGATAYLFRPAITTGYTPLRLTSTDHIELDVRVGSTYTYQVSACDGSGCSDSTYSNPVTIKPPEPAMPTGVTATVSGSSIIVSWGAVSTATSYTIQRTVGGAVSNIEGYGGTSYADTGLSFQYNLLVQREGV